MSRFPNVGLYVNVFPVNVSVDGAAPPVRVKLPKEVSPAPIFALGDTALNPFTAPDVYEKLMSYVPESKAPPMASRKAI